ncbi:prolyl oligopeptidase family serine peptidase [Nocardiopsis trehalosi]|uniref:prolyl oligopeptidase family serine peptidase n=1 Tax=Nocardiopsis trehalosi TaxID=109329 RepID=UPI0009FF5DF9|nr:prolyl oligopeptidase family serine peptidase [Nocardiopsis trehalosi]
MSTASSRPAAPAPGPDDRAPVVEVRHGRTVADPFRWLEEPDSPATRRWLDDRARDFARAAAAWPLREALARDIRRLVAVDLWSPPVRRGRRAFATRRRAGDDHPALVVDAGGGADGPRVVFDPVVLDPSGRTTLDAWEPDPAGRWVAVQTSTGGTERGALRVLSADTGLPVEEPIPGVRYSHVAWLPGGAGAFYYVRRDDGDGRRGVWLHRVARGGPRTPDVLVRPCSGPRTVPGVRLLRDRWLVVTESHGTGHRTDLWIADLAAGRPDAPPWRTVHAGVEAESEPDVGPDGVLYLRTTLGAPRRRVCAADPADPAPARWREVVPEDPGATLDGFAAGGTAAAPELLTTRTRLGISDLTVHDARDGRPLRRPRLPGEGMVSRLEAAPDGTARFCYADVATQQVVLELPAGGAEPRPWPEGAAPPPPPRVHRTVLTCASADGTRVPVTLFAAEGAPPGPGPTILHAYGGFGRPRRFGFSATVLAWLLAGGRYAVAHVRGGGDAGRAWHLAGAGRRKARAVEDLVAAAEELAARGVCTPARLCLSGGSAGGLLVLAAAVLRPEVCGAVVASAPLADMARFERLGLGAMWTREFGTADDPDDFAALMAYSPYHRALEGAGRRYPAVLLTGFHGDTRTDAAHPRKMCAALAAVGAPVLLRYEHGVGHGPRAVTSAIALAADAHAFAAARTGLPPG